MKINIKHLDKHEVFAVLYNHAANNIGCISNEEAKHILETYQSRVGNCGPLYFDYFDATGFLFDGDYSDFGVFMKIDFSYHILWVDKFDEKHGPGTCEALINNLRLKKIEELTAAIPYRRSLEGQLRAEDHWKKRPEFPAYEAMAEALADLQVEVEIYERLSIANAEIKKMKEQQNNDKASSSSPWFFKKP